MTTLNGPGSAREALQAAVPLDALRLMTQAALMAVCHQSISDAQLIVDGMYPTFGEYAAVAMARATVTSASGDGAQALVSVEALLRAHPELGAVRCACAMLRKELGLTGWQVLAETVLADADDASAAALAAQLLESSPHRVAGRSSPGIALSGMRFTAGARA